MAVLEHNFSRGLDLLFDPTGNTPLANHVFVSKSGDDGLGDGSLLNPYLTINGAIVGEVPNQANTTFVVGSGDYPEVELFQHGKILGDGIVTVHGTGVEWMIAPGNNNDGELENIRIGNYIGFRSLNLGEVLIATDVTFFDIPNVGQTINQQVTWNRCNLVNFAWESTANDVLLNDCKMFNSSFTKSGVGNMTANNCHIDATSTITKTSAGTFNLTNNNINGSTVGFRDTDVGNIDLPALFEGDVFDNEYQVDITSPLIQGFNNRMIGNVKFGSFQDENSTEFGVSPASNVNTQFTAGVFDLINAGLDGVRESGVIDLGKIYTSPTVNQLGLTDYSTNVIAFNNTWINPKHLTIEIRYSEDNVTFTPYKSFKLTERIYLDTGGASTGENGFLWSDADSGLADQKMRYLQIRVSLTNNYVPA